MILGIVAMFASSGDDDGQGCGCLIAFIAFVGVIVSLLDLGLGWLIAFMVLFVVIAVLLSDLTS